MEKEAAGQGEGQLPRLSMGERGGPRTRRDCLTQAQQERLDGVSDGLGDGINCARPCPWVSCGYHLAWCASRHRPKLLTRWPDRLIPCGMPATCALDEADDGQGRTLVHVARLLRVTREKVRQVELRALRKLYERRGVALLFAMLRRKEGKNEPGHGKQLRDEAIDALESLFGRRLEEGEIAALAGAGPHGAGDVRALRRIDWFGGWRDDAERDGRRRRRVGGEPPDRGERAAPRAGDPGGAKRR